MCRDRGRGSFDDADDDRPPREELGPSKADTSSSWGADRRPREPSPDRPARGGGFGDSYTERDRKQSGGFADRYGEDRGSLADRGPSKADEEDRWSRKPVEPSSDRPSRGDDRNSSFGAPRSDSAESWGARRSALPAETASAAASTERRRLNLSARTAPPKELPPIVAPTPKPAADEPQAAVPREQPDAPALPPKPKSNPFGTARPREEVLKEQGRDWKREERALEHSRVKRSASCSCLVSVDYLLLCCFSPRLLCKLALWHQAAHVKHLCDGTYWAAGQTVPESEPERLHMA